MAAMELAEWIFKWKFKSHQRDVPEAERQRLLRRLIRNRLEQSLLESALRHADEEISRVNAALVVPHGEVTMPPPPLALKALGRAIERLVDAVLLRVVQRRGPDDEGLKTGAWLTSFREACLEVTPRLISPKVSLPTLERRLSRLRARAGLPTLEDLPVRVRRSQRSVGLARLRAWGLKGG